MYYFIFFFSGPGKISTHSRLTKQTHDGEAHSKRARRGKKIIKMAFSKYCGSFSSEEERAREKREEKLYIKIGSNGANKERFFFHDEALFFLGYAILGCVDENST